MALRKATGALLTTGLGAATVAYRYERVRQREAELPKNSLSVFDDGPKPNRQRQQVVIVGAGVVGVSTAYKLAQRGHEVVVLVRIDFKFIFCIVASKLRATNQDPSPFRNVSYGRNPPLSLGRNAVTVQLVECLGQMWQWINILGLQS